MPKAAWLKQYIDCNNTENRKKSSCDFEKDIWKLLNNSFYGILNQWKTKETEWVQNFQMKRKLTLKRLISKTNFTSMLRNLMNSVKFSDEEER